MTNSRIWIAIVIVLVVAGGIYFMSTQSSAPPASLQSSQDAQNPAASTQVQSTQTQPISQHMITLQTTLGDITFETYDADAPKTVQNFIILAQKGFYDNVIFHRVIEGFMIQGGDPTGTGRGGPGYTFADELNPATPSYTQGYKRGVVAMANAGPNTNGSQFFIMLQDTPLPHNYTIFGKVVKGQEVVDAIGKLPTDPNDRPLNPPAIKKVVVEATP